MIRFWQGVCLACALALGLSSALAQGGDWPRTLPVGDGLMTIYPLQIDGMQGDVVRYRAALAWRPTTDAEPVFGAGWFESTVEIDRDGQTVRGEGLRVNQVRFPEQTEEMQDQLAAALAARSPGWNLEHSLDQFEADLQAAAAEADSLRQLNTAPPKIVYRDHPALLVTLDGDPLMRDVEDTPYRAVINTPYPLISDGRHFYLNVAKDVWYRSDQATGPYEFASGPPAGIAALVKPEETAASAEPPAFAVTAASAPEIVVATEPTELIVTEGPAVFVPLVDDLLVLQNSDDDLFLHVGSQQFYIVLAGRWYRANSLNGPWTYQAAAGLPPAFAEIPRSSAQSDARVYVAGTEEASAAVLDAQVPQTRAVNRGPADLDVSYDGAPAFQPVDGTDLQYAVNTGDTVLQSERRYYLVEDGVWYESDSPNGPWQVSAWRPQAVSRIAPTSPVYHVKYVYIYDRTPDVVYVGYTPGYLGNYVHRGTVVYGTGWHYRPWVSPYDYYPRPATWGYHVSYNPWSGWGFGLSWNWGWGWDPFYSSWWAGGYWHHHHHWHHSHFGYWGHRGYRPRPAHDSHRGHAGRDHGRRHDAGYGDGGGRPNPGHGGNTVAPREGSRIGPDPMTRSDLRLKARVRDTNGEAARSLMEVDRNGKVRRKTPIRPKSPSPVALAKQIVPGSERAAAGPERAVAATEKPRQRNRRRAPDIDARERARQPERPNTSGGLSRWVANAAQQPRRPRAEIREAPPAQSPRAGSAAISQQTAPPKRRQFAPVDPPPRSERQVSRQAGTSKPSAPQADNRSAPGPRQGGQRGSKRHARDSG